jgi:hypothetical protein
MITTQEILALAKKYVDQKLSLDEFSHAFAEVFYDIEETGDVDAVKLAYAIEAKLAAVTAGVNSEADLRQAVASLLPSESPVTIVMKPILNEQKLPPFSQHVVALFSYLGSVANQGKESLVYAGIELSAGFASGASLPAIPQTSTGQFPSQLVLTGR